MLNTIALWVIFVSAPVVFLTLFFFTAPYGRHFRTGWGPSVSARIGWLVMESPAFLVIGITVFASGRPIPLLTVLLLLLWEGHYAYRSYVFPFLMRDTGRRFPVLLILFAFVFNSLNGYANGHFLSSVSSVTDGSFLQNLRVCVGIAMFAAGFLTHVISDSTLRNLRKPGEEGYKIPRGGLFEYVTSPNYFGEILEWCGWAVATWSLAGLAFAVFTVANLVPRAWSNRKWYLATFPDYPRDRKSVIPFVF